MNLPAMRKTYLILFISMLAAICTQAQNPKKEYKLGLEFFDTKNYSDAINQFTKAIELKTDYVDAYVKRGDAYEALTKHKKQLMIIDGLLLLKIRMRKFILKPE